RDDLPAPARRLGRHLQRDGRRHIGRGRVADGDAAPARDRLSRPGCAPAAPAVPERGRGCRHRPYTSTPGALAPTHARSTACGRWAGLRGQSTAVVRSGRRAAGLGVTVVSAPRALLPYGGEVPRGNADARAAAGVPDAIGFWAVLDPRRPEGFGSLPELLAHP